MVDKLAKLKELIEDNDAFMRLSNMMNDMQIEMMQHNWPAEERVEKARIFRNELFIAISDYRDWWVARYHPATPNK